SGRSYGPSGAWIYADDGYDRSERTFERHYFYSSNKGETEVNVPAGKVVIEISRGLEERPYRKVVEVQRDKAENISLKLEPLSLDSLHAEHWVASDLHVHMNYGGTYRNDAWHLAGQGEAEGLDVINELPVNKEQRFPDVG